MRCELNSPNVRLHYSTESDNDLPCKAKLHNSLCICYTKPGIELLTSKCSTLPDIELLTSKCPTLPAV